MVRPPTPRSERSLSPASDDDTFRLHKFTTTGIVLDAMERTHRMFDFQCSRLLADAEEKSVDRERYKRRQVVVDSSHVERRVKAAVDKRKAKIDEGQLLRQQRIRQAADNRLAMEDQVQRKIQKEQEVKQRRQERVAVHQQEVKERHQQMVAWRSILAEEKRANAAVRAAGVQAKAERAHKEKEDKEERRKAWYDKEKIVMLDDRREQEQFEARLRRERIEEAHTERLNRIHERRLEKQAWAEFLQTCHSQTVQYADGMRRHISNLHDEIRRVHQDCEKSGDLSAMRSAVDKARQMVPPPPMFQPPERPQPRSTGASTTGKAAGTAGERSKTPPAGSLVLETQTSEGKATGAESSEDVVLKPTPDTDQVGYVRYCFQRDEFCDRAAALAKLIEKIDGMNHFNLVKELGLLVKDLKGEKLPTFRGTKIPFLAASCPGSVFHVELTSGATALKKSAQAFKDSEKFGTVIEELNALLESTAGDPSGRVPGFQRHGVGIHTSGGVVTGDASNKEASTSALTPSSLPSDDQSPERGRKKKKSRSEEERLLRKIEELHRDAYRRTEEIRPPSPEDTRRAEGPGNSDEAPEYRLYEAMFAAPVKGKAAPCGRHVVASTRIAAMRSGLLAAASANNREDQKVETMDIELAQDYRSFVGGDTSASEATIDINSLGGSGSFSPRKRESQVSFSPRVDVIELQGLGDRYSVEYTTQGPQRKDRSRLQVGHERSPPSAEGDAE